MGYWKKCDCDKIKIEVMNLQIYDNSNYPDTLDPNKEYTKDAEIVIDEILGVNEPDSNPMLRLELVLFTYPEETGCCPLQPGKDYNMKLEVVLRQIRINFITERTIRIIDYIIN